MWPAEIRQKTKKAEADLLAHLKLKQLIPSTDQNLIELYKKLF